MSTKITRELIEELVDNDEGVEKFKEIIEDDLTDNDVKLIMEVIREKRLQELFEKLNIDPEKLEKARKKKITLHPQSVKWPLFSTLYRDKKGKYKVEDLIYEHHDSILREGMIVEISYGKKFAVEDLQNKRFTKEYIRNMSREEMEEYLYEDREEI